MTRMLYTLLEVSAGAVFLLPIYYIWNKVSLHSTRKSVCCCIFSLYLAAVYVLVGMPNVTYIRLELNLNPIPLLGMIDDLKNSILNVLLFVPLGFLLPVLWKRYRARKATVLFGFGMSLAIELLQILTFRATDVNDLITNVLGTFLGFTMADVIMKKIPAVKDLAGETGELYIVCAITFAVMFFLHPFASSILYGLLP